MRLNLALGYRDIVAFGCAGVDLTRAVDLGGRVAAHFLPVGNPAGHPSEGEQHGEHIGGDAHRTVDDSTVEIDVRVKFALDEVGIVEGDFFQILGNF